VFRHNNVRDILKHAAIGAGLSAVVTEKKNQVVGSKVRPGDISVQQYHRGFATSAFDVTISHPLQKKYIEIAMEEGGVAAADAHDRKLLKSLEVCEKAFTLFLWLGSRLEGQLRRCTRLFASGRSWRVLVVVTLRT
jgi:hypothetical protein